MTDNLDIPLRQAILAVPGVSALLDDRVYADGAVPEKEVFPYGVLTMVGDVARVYSLNGGALKTLRARYQVDFYAETKDDATSLRKLVSARRQDDGLDGYKGTLGSGGDAVHAQCCQIENRRNGSELLVDNSDRFVYSSGCDIVVTFNE